MVNYLLLLALDPDRTKEEVSEVYSRYRETFNSDLVRGNVGKIFIYMKMKKVP